MKKLWLYLLFCIPTTLFTQEVLRLEGDQSPGKGKLEQLTWLEGYWQGEWHGEYCDEIWMPATDISMSGIFRMKNEGLINFTEYMVIEEKEESLSVKLKHFSRDLSPWEEKDKWIEFKLVKIEDQTAYFNGLTYHRENDQLTIKLMMKSRNSTRIETISLKKVTI